MIHFVGSSLFDDRETSSPIAATSHLHHLPPRQDPAYQRSVTDAQFSPRPAAFLDRDGVINIDTGYPHRPDQLAFTPTAPAGIRRLNQAGHLVIVVTNQSGVARGLFTIEDVNCFHSEINRQLSLHGAWIDTFYIAPYHGEGVVEAYAVDHPDRKPAPGMLLRAMEEWSIDPGASFLIGDKDSDMEAARRAGIEGVLVPADVCDLDAVVAELLAR